MFSLYLGLRAKEIASLCRGYVYDKDGKVRELLRLQAAYTKGAKTRDVYLTSPQLKTVLVEYEKQYSWWRARIPQVSKKHGSNNRVAAQPHSLCVKELPCLARLCQWQLPDPPHSLLPRATIFNAPSGNGRCIFTDF